MFGSEGYHPRCALLVTSETPDLSIGDSSDGQAGGFLWGVVRRESYGRGPRLSTKPRCIWRRTVRPEFGRSRLAANIKFCGYAGFRAAVAALGASVRLVTEHSSATSRARADLLLAADVPSKLAPCVSPG